MRDYDPTTGRYIQADPLGLVDGASVYGYALGNPLRWTDPKGECIGPFALLAPVCMGAAAGALANLLAQLLMRGCVDWSQVLDSALIGAAIGGAFLAGGALGKVSTGFAGAARPTYRLLKYCGIRIESHPIRKWWPDWANWPHWHIEKISKWHLPIIEPITALLAAKSAFFDGGCDCQCSESP